MLYVKVINVLKLSLSSTYHSFEQFCPVETLFCFEVKFRFFPSSLMMGNLCRMLKWSNPLPLRSIIFIIYSKKFHVLLQFLSLVLFFFFPKMFKHLHLHLSFSNTFTSFGLLFSSSWIMSLLHLLPEFDTG